MSGRNGSGRSGGGPVTGPPPILPIRKSDDLRMSKSLLDGHSLSVVSFSSQTLRHFVIGSGQPKKYISAQRDMMYLKGGLFVFETKMTLDRS